MITRDPSEVVERERVRFLNELGPLGLFFEQRIGRLWIASDVHDFPRLVKDVHRHAEYVLMAVRLAEDQVDIAIERHKQELEITKRVLQRAHEASPVPGAVEPRGVGERGEDRMGGSGTGV